MKKFISVLILLALGTALIACSSSGIQVPDGMQIASSGDVAYNLFVPGGWILTESNGICGAYYSTSDESSITVSSLYPDGEMLSISDYWSTLEASYTETFKNFSIVEAPEADASNVILGDKASFKYVFTADIDGESYKFMQILSVHNNMFYTMTYTSTAENYDSHLEDVEKTITEFKFK
ncbi:MAG: hypothetical protein IJZ89_08505 [Clostridia bacterium]|nr:hypothetical protein [Clostridia bacterium]